eukprot:COSAG01_NODE_6247_length_3771_cov_379.905229_5_plen_52_part_00
MVAGLRLREEAFLQGVLYSYVRPYSIVILTQLLQYRILSTAVRTVLCMGPL